MEMYREENKRDSEKHTEKGKKSESNGKVGKVERKWRKKNVVKERINVKREREN